MKPKTKPRSARVVKTQRKNRRTGIHRFRRSELLIFGGVAILILVAFVYANRTSSSPLDVNLAAIPDDSVLVNSQGGQHIEVGASHPPYNSNPPTSGPHYVVPANLGIYTSPLPDEQLVHNLEHGHIWLSYRDANDQEAIRVLTDLQSRNRRYVIVTHRPQNDKRIAAAAWTRLFTTDDLSADQLQAFILRYQDRAPESIPGM